MKGLAQRHLTYKMSSLDSNLGLSQMEAPDTPLVS